MRTVSVILLLSSLAWSATQLTYKENVTIRNNDVGECTTNSFNLSASMPSGWKISYSANPVTILPQQSGIVTAVITVPKTAKVGTYPVSVKVVHNRKYSGTATVNVVVF